MDSFEWNKIAGAVLGTLLFVVAVRIASGFIFEVEPPAKPGYVVQGVEAPSGTGATQAAAEEQLPDWGTVLPKANVADGKSISTRCEQCHDLSKGGPNKIGPNLWGVVGRPARVSSGLRLFRRDEGERRLWSYDELFKFLKSPGAYIPGTKMSFAGLRSADDRINLIAYLRTDMDSPAPFRRRSRPKRLDRHRHPPTGKRRPLRRMRGAQDNAKARMAPPLSRPATSQPPQRRLPARGAPAMPTGRPAATAAKIRA